MNRGRNCDSNLPYAGSVFSLCGEESVIINTGQRSRMLGLVGVRHRFSYLASECEIVTVLSVWHLAVAMYLRAF